MARIKPFQGLRPALNLAGQVIAPPYDVMSESEARSMVGDNPNSFLRVTRPEVGLPPGSDAHGDEAYLTARRALDGLISSGVLVQEQQEAFYLYSQVMGNHRQAGLMALCAVDEYDSGKIKRHEFTRPDKEQDRVNHIQTTSAQTGLVFLAYRKDASIEALQNEVLAGEPLFEVTTPDGVEHALHVIDDPGDVSAWKEAFAAVDALYIADGHHRSAAASRVCALRGGLGGSDSFLAGVFPDDQLYVMAYNRVVRDLLGQSSEEFMQAVKQVFEVQAGVGPAPDKRGEIHMFFEGQWFGLKARPGVVNAADPVASLDVAVLQDHLLSPILGIQDPRRDTRIRFVGGIRGPVAISSAVEQGDGAVGFSLFPTGLDQLFSVADSGAVMPPKSTWFEPKLAGGVVVHRLED
ncbi:MAG: DUF1015 family protein [Myxococcota bacterium]|nr:DUF1015 family protein [Myxococcota bacterium]